MSYIVHEVAQGSMEWHQARAGVITASMFGEVMKVTGGLTEQQQVYVDARKSGKTESEAKEVAGYKAKPTTDKIQAALDGERVGDWTEVAKSYAFRLAVERISGEPLDEGHETWAMRRGKELEPAARATHALLHNVTVEKAGFVATEDGKFGASADGFIDEDGGSEYKCLIAPEPLRTIIVDRNIDEYLPQCQGGMWITGRNYWHFCVYCPALAAAKKDLIMFPVRRDDSYIDAMEQTLVRFDKVVEDYKAKIMQNETGGEK